MMNYEITKTIASGEHTKTLLAKAPKSNREVIIKQLSLNKTSDWKIIELFHRECEGLKQLDHPGIPKYIDHFELETDGDLLLSLVQEYIPGKNLKEKIEDGEHLDNREIFRIIKEALEILDYLQSLNPPVIHRDIKPSNIIFTPYKTISLIDFGAIQKELSGYTGGSTVIGTTGYMPPEQLMGKADPRSDLYALGATIIYLITHKSPGDLPFEKMQIQYEAYADISAPFKEFINTLIAPDSSERFQTPKEALKALERVKAGVSITPSAPTDIKELKGRKSGVLIGFVAALLLFVAGILFFTVQSAPSEAIVIQERTQTTQTAGSLKVSSALAACIRAAAKKPRGPLTRSDLEGITKFECKGMGLRSIKGVEQLTGVRYLYLSENSITDLSPLKGLPDVTSLSINSNQISDISVITTMPKLERIYAYKNKIKKLPDISKTGIEYISIWSNPLEDISGVANSTKLKDLSIGHSSISDISPLASVKNLEKISGTYARVSDLTPLKDLTGLKKVEFGNNQISDITPLSNLTRITWLTLSNNRIKDLTPIKNMRDLEWLMITDNQIQSLKPLKNLDRLKTAYLSRNEIRSLEGIEGCESLENLHLYNNSIADLKPLSGLKWLKKLDLYNNHVTDLSPLSTLERLEMVNIKGNNISDLSPIKSVEKIKKD